MDILGYIRGAIIMSLVNLGVGVLEVKQQTTRQHMDACIDLGKEPNFDTEIVIGEPWKIYYTWNLFDLQRKCMIIQFNNATATIVDRIYSDMHKYLDQQPAWEAATLLATMVGLGSQQEMLLFAAQGPAGYFLGVPNVIRDGRSLPIRNNVEPVLFQLKLFDNNKYLVMMDCKLGVTTLMAREQHKRKAASFAATLKIPGDGSPTCIV